MSNEVQTKDGPAADRVRIEDYLRGESAAYREVDGWIRVELQVHYPRLADEHEDLCQIAHSKVLVALREQRYEGRSSLRSYVQSIAHRTALDRLRGLYRNRAVMTELAAEPKAGADNPYRLIELRDELRIAHQAVMALPDACRELWKLVFVEKLDYTEAGLRLSIPEGTVKSRMWYCRRKAMKALRQLRLLQRLRLAPGGEPRSYGAARHHRSSS